MTAETLFVQKSSFPKPVFFKSLLNLLPKEEKKINSFLTDFPKFSQIFLNFLHKCVLKQEQVFGRCRAEPHGHGIPAGLLLDPALCWAQARSCLGLSIPAQLCCVRVWGKNGTGLLTMDSYFLIVAADIG